MLIRNIEKKDKQLNDPLERKTPVSEKKKRYKKKKEKEVSQNQTLIVSYFEREKKETVNAKED